MWRSGNGNSDDEPKPKSRLLPPSSQQLGHAKSTRKPSVPQSYFRQQMEDWKPVVRPKVETEEPKVVVDPDNLPAYLRPRPTGKKPPLFFRTDRGKIGKKK